MKIAIFFGQYGPYHHARVVALQKSMKIYGIEVIPVQVAAFTSTYAWKSAQDLAKAKSNSYSLSNNPCGEFKTLQAEGLVTLCTGTEEDASPFEVFIKAQKLLRNKMVKAAFLPSYSPSRYFALFAAAYSLGIHTIMMNESHASTADASRLKHWLKCQIVKRFNAALVGGEPHKRHFHDLGMPLNQIFTGYDAIDNSYFADRADHVRSIAKNLRIAYGLPSRYFLSLGRMVPKKNLRLLIEAYARLTHNRTSRSLPSLVFVGSGELENNLQSIAKSLGLRVVDRRKAPQDDQHKSIDQESDFYGSVYFYGFRQIDENSIFYALSDAFILPSLQEEWGLVVNEAMACSLPVIVSKAAGCAEDLLPIHDTAHKGTSAAHKTEDSYTNIEQRTNGYVFNPNSVESLQLALQNMASLSDEQRSKMGSQSRKIIEHFSCENFAQQAILAIKEPLGIEP